MLILLSIPGKLTSSDISSKLAAIFPYKSMSGNPRVFALFSVNSPEQLHIGTKYIQI
jgi:hypothetical protein